MRWTSRIAISLMLLTVAGVARAGSEDEVKALFAKFVAAQNAHDLKAVGELLQDSPNFLWITRGMPIWAAMQRSSVSRRYIRAVPVGNLIRLVREAESRNASVS